VQENDRSAGAAPDDLKIDVSDPHGRD
jgi:hypothetical protein